MLLIEFLKRKQAEEERTALIKELEKTNRKLDKSNKELQDFAYIVSHDLKAPVRKGAMFGELLTESLAGKLDENEQENFEFMIEGATWMQQLIDALLTYSRVATRAKLLERVDLNEVVGALREVELALQLEEGNYETVFGMFQRLHADDKGTGVGLTVCTRIVERHEGEIGVESTPGEGSRFWFTIPMANYELQIRKEEV